MRCPKCHYLSFEPEPRCRNCGFDLSVGDVDLPIKADEPASSGFVDLDLRPSTAPPAPPMEVPPATPVRPVASTRRRVESGAKVAGVRPAAHVSAAPTAELPLFVKGLSAGESEAVADSPVRDMATADAALPDAADAPLVTLPAAPRAPLGVRRQVGDASAPPRPRTSQPSRPAIGQEPERAPPQRDSTRC
jgi:hypothetical protein